MALSLERQEAYRRRYAAETAGWRPATHVYRDVVAARLRPSIRILDLGCGRGGILEQLYPQVGRAVGVDPDRVSLCDHRIAGFPLACAFAAALPFPAGAFDLICCSWVLEHLAQPAPALAEVSRLLAPGGRFVFVTPNRRHPLLWLNRSAACSRSGWVNRLYGRAEADTFPAFYRANSPAAIASLVRGAGLELVDLVLVDDPTYLAFNDLFYRLSCWLARCTPADMRVHIVGEAGKPALPTPAR
ncbi:MAG: class I SAM-dependent methyltransferase [Anaerolineae bacterium]|nr:class I SAM-dependent methyltransferase [Anaerolineae bacterium]